jgi:hypothetical protein
MLFAQISNPVAFPKSDPPKWYETDLFKGAIGLCATFFIAAVSMTAKGIFTHIFFGLSWSFGTISLWAFCNGVFRKRKRTAWITASILLGILFAAADAAVLHLKIFGIAL